MSVKLSQQHSQHHVLYVLDWSQFQASGAKLVSADVLGTILEARMSLPEDYCPATPDTGLQLNIAMYCGLLLSDVITVSAHMDLPCSCVRPEV